MAHPFPKGHFKISSAASDRVHAGARPVAHPVCAGAQRSRARAGAGEWRGHRHCRADAVGLMAEPVPNPSRNSVAPPPPARCAAARAWRTVMRSSARPSAATRRSWSSCAPTRWRRRRACRELIDGIVADVMQQGESSIRLLSENMGDRACMHPVNVTVLSLLLGKALGLDERRTAGSRCGRLPARHRQDPAAGAGALDGQPPERRRLPRLPGPCGARHRAGAPARRHRKCTARPRRAPRDHGCAAAFRRVRWGAAISLPGKILALVNRYDNMCNPAAPSAAA
jgi:hypothetical protein